MSFMRGLRLRAHRLHRPAHLLEHLVGELRAQTLEQAPRSGPRPPPTRSRGAAARRPCRRGRPAAGRGRAAAPRRGARPPRRAARVAVPLGGGARLDLGAVDGVALLVDDVVELAGDLVVDAAEVEAVEAVPAGLAQPLEQLAEPGDPLAVGAAQPVVHQPPQRGVDVAVLDQVVGDRAEEVVGVQLEPALRPVPPRVRVALRHRLHRTRGRPARPPSLDVDACAAHVRVRRPVRVHQLHRRVRRRCRRPPAQRLPDDRSPGRVRARRAHRQVARRRLHGRRRRPARRDRLHPRPARRARPTSARRSRCAPGSPAGTPCCSRATTTSAPP